MLNKTERRFKKRDRPTQDKACIGSMDMTKCYSNCKPIENQNGSMRIQANIMRLRFRAFTEILIQISLRMPKLM